MKKALRDLSLVFAIILLAFLFGCGETEVKECSIDCEDINLLLGDSFTITPISTVSNPKYEYRVEGSSVTINNGIIYGAEVGTSKVTISIKGYSGSKEITITVGKMGLTITGKNTVIIKEELELSLITFGLDEDAKIVWKTSDSNIARVSKGIVTGIDLGKATITAKCEEYVSSIEIEVIRPAIQAITSSDSLTFEENAQYDIQYDVEPFYALKDIKIEANNDCVTIGDDNSIIANKKGSCILKLISCADNKVTKEIAVTIEKNEAPQFEFNADYQETINLVYGQEYDLLKGIKVIDNVDGDITKNIEYDENFVYAYGEHEITLLVRDKAGNVATTKRKINTTWQYDIQFIGHRGCTYGVPNTEEAFIYGASVLHYQALECDIHLTKDGIFVTNHDSYLTLTNEAGESYKVTISQTNYEDLIQYELKSGNYTGHVCTLERYLDICKLYGCEAVIELKTTTGVSDSSQANMPKLVQVVKDHGMWENSIFLVSSKPCITWLRNYSSTIRIQYLYKSEITDDILNYCKTNNLGISVNVTSGTGISDEFIQKFHNEGLIVSTWTFTKYISYAKLQEWIDKGVDYVTCDMQSMDKVTLK